MMNWIWLFTFLVCFGTLSYQRATLHVWTATLAAFLILFSVFSQTALLGLIFSWLIFFVAFTPCYATKWRQRIFSRHVYNFYRRSMPAISRTEKEALAAGTVSWEGELFQGAPRWNTLLNMPKPQLTPEEQAFIDGPVETLCKMINDWDITHNRADMPEEMWDFIKKQGFFGLIIPKEYGGKEFSAFAHSEILIKIYGKSGSVASTVGVPNSLGPAELLLHYGTPEQKQYYLPRLATGEEVPCFALTGPEAGSDAGAMTDTGIVCWGDFKGKKTLGIRLNWNKRYITLAPVATVIGLAFKLHDPDHLIGDHENAGITCALIPRDLPGITIGRRHFLSNIVFQNGPTQGKDVFVPVDYIIGGPSMAGQGWRMLMECLAAGRAITLPASALGAAKVLSYVSGAYSHIRQQFNVPIGKFEGIEEVLAQIGGLTYAMEATRAFTAGMIDAGEKPAVASAITKYHVTEMGRIVVNAAMDLHAGKGICLGPKNYIGRFYQSIPIGITVEGANILTRSLIIFGQGAMRCHPYVLNELEAAQNKDEQEGLRHFDLVLMKHMSFTLSNIIRTIVLSLTSAIIVKTPRSKTKRYFQHATRFSAAFALLTDMSMLIFGGKLKRKENISARLGDIVSQLYIISAVLKHFDNQGKNNDDLPLVHWACQNSLYQIQQKIDGLLKNFPNRWLAKILGFLIFPVGKRFTAPSDALNHTLAELLMGPTATRYRLAKGAFVTPCNENTISFVEDALIKVIAAEPVEKIIKAAIHHGHLDERNTLIEQGKLAFTKKLISESQLTLLIEADEARRKVIAVDDFAPEELRRTIIEYTTISERA